MANPTNQLNQVLVDGLRTMAREGKTPSEMLKSLKRIVAGDTHLLTIMHYFMQAFCLSLLEAKPVVVFSLHEDGEVKNEALFDELLVPAILKMRKEWDA